MKKQFLSFALVAGLAATSIAQNPILVWEENLGGTATDVATTVVATADGGSITGGYTNSTNGDVVGHISGYDAWVVKQDAFGTVQWKRVYGGSGDDFCYAMIQDAAGNFVFTGTTNSSNGDIASNNGAFDMWVVKLDASGNIMFSKTLGGSDDEAGYGIVQTNDLGYAMAGESKTDMLAGNINRGGYDCYIAKVNTSGTTVFQKLYGGSDDETLKSIAQTPNGDLYAAGETESNNFNVSGNKGGYDFYVLRMKKTGALVWARTYGGTTNDNAHSITTSGKAIVIAGETESNNGDVPDNSGSDDFWVLKLNNAGSIMFSKTFGGETSDIARSVINTPDGLVVVGETESSSGDVANNYGNDDYWFVKLSATGTLEYEHNYGGAITDVAYDVARRVDGNFIVAGSSQSDNVDVTDNNGNDDFWVIVLDNPAAKMMSTMESNTTISAYPNPTVAGLTLESPDVILEYVILDINGRTVAFGQPVAHQAKIDMSELTSGIYLVRTTLENGSIEMTKVIKQ